MTSTPASGRRHPRNPWIGLYFAALFLLGGTAATILFIRYFDVAIAGDVAGQRTAGFVLTAPAIFLALGIWVGVRAVRAIAPWNRYRSATTLDDRRRDRALDLDRDPDWRVWFYGIAALAGWVFFVLALAGLTPLDMTRPAISLMAFQFAVLLMLAWTACFGLFAQIWWYRRFRPSPTV